MTYNISPIISLTHITQYSGHFYFGRALIVNNVFIIADYLRFYVYLVKDLGLKLTCFDFAVIYP